MTEYRVISAKSYIPFIIGPEQGGATKLDFFPQYRTGWTTKRSQLRLETPPYRGILTNEEDEDGWMFYPNMLKFDHIGLAFEHIKMAKEIAEYGRKIHPYPSEELEPSDKFIKIVDEKYKNVIYYVKESCYNSSEYQFMNKDGVYHTIGNIRINWHIGCWAEFIIDTDRNTVIKSRTGCEYFLDKMLSIKV